jgi:hypothetical protein
MWRKYHSNAFAFEIEFNWIGTLFMKKQIFAGAWLLVTAGFAQAADMPLKAPPAPLPPPPVFSWTGLYVGADIGGA